MKLGARTILAPGLTLLGGAVFGAVQIACSLDAGGLGGEAAASSGASSSSGNGSTSSSASSGAGGASASSASSSSASSSSASSSSASSSSASSGGGGGAGGTTCATLHQQNTMNGVYMIDPDGPGGAPPFQAYCEMVADGGGWTLALKIDGTMSNFDFDAARWEDSSTFQANKPDLDTKEAKLATFSTVSFTDLRLGMIDQGMTRWITLTLPGSQTLLTLFQGANVLQTKLGRSEWMKLIANPALQPNCDAEGFNRYPAKPKNARARIGILGNDQNDCSSPDSVIGFGADDGAGHHGTGNFTSFNFPNDRNTPTFGYVMVR